MVSVTPILTVVAVLAIVYPGLARAEYCYEYSYGYYSYTYCAYGCCGSTYDRYCCTPVGIIAGAVVGGIIFIACCIAVVCFFMKKKGRTGMVVNPGSTVPAVTTVTYTGQQYPTYPQGQHGYHPYPGGGQPMQQYPPPPGAPSGIYNNDPAYPPPPPAYGNVNQRGNTANPAH